MELTKLFELQRRLDQHIEEEHPAGPHEDRLTKRIIALDVEMGELINELPEVFKFWSLKKNNYEKALKEYVDGLHFFLSIGLDLEVKDYVFNDLEAVTWSTIERQVKQTFIWISKLSEKPCPTAWRRAFAHFLGIAKMLGFTWEQVEKAYMLKNAENHLRQESGY